MTQSILATFDTTSSVSAQQATFFANNGGHLEVGTARFCVSRRGVISM
jgi:hypothetical protein